MTFEWDAFALGLLGGSLASALFFGGLALGIRYALRAGRPARMLLLSAAVRIALLLGMAWWTAGQGVSAVAGFALAFIALRYIVVAALRPRSGPERRGWN